MTLDKEVRKLRSDLDSMPVSRALGRALSLAEDRGDGAMARWCRLELQGYSNGNPAMGEDIRVPEYRTVVGQHRDIYGRLFLAPPEVPFVNEDRLRMGVAQLERLERDRVTITIQNPGMVEIIREQLAVDVYSFTFSSTDITSILASIRAELSSKLAALALPVSALREDVLSRSPDDILEIKPGIWGVHLNVRALWRRLRAS